MKKLRIATLAALAGSLLLTACGDPVTSSTGAQAVAPAPMLEDAVTLPAMPTAIDTRAVIVQLQLAASEWRLHKPRGYETLAASDGQGVLWIAFPPVADPVGWGDHPRPAGDYRIMYTPARPAGGDLDQGASELLRLPGTVDGADRYIVALTSVANGHFLLDTYTIPPNAQNGGTVEDWWLEPASGTNKIVLTATGNRSKSLTIAKTDNWLFWSSAACDETGLPMKGQSYLVDLRTGQTRALQLGTPNWPRDALWQGDGKLHYHLPGANEERVLDPAGE